METQFYIAAAFWIMLLINRMIILGGEKEKKTGMNQLKEENI